jgi:spore germination cell wall hydrolase CwlJ-like protein
MMKRTIIFVLGLIILPINLVDYSSAEKDAIAEMILAERAIKLEFERQVTCLAKNIFYEAGSEPYEGKLAVATVTMNRVDHKQFPDNVCDVVYQSNPRGCQFSWTCGAKGKFHEATYEKSYAVALQVLTEDLRLSKLRKALYFHNTTIDPEWTFATPIHQIGNHIFYEPRRNNTSS